MVDYSTPSLNSTRLGQSAPRLLPHSFPNAAIPLPINLISNLRASHWIYVVQGKFAGSILEALNGRLKTNEFSPVSKASVGKVNFFTKS
jgi:hypothetical protein